MLIPHQLKRRLVGLTAIGALFAVQSIYEFFLCGGGITGFWIVTIILAVPVTFALLISGSPAALTMCLVLVPFILWANEAECAPYVGGGAAMAYVVVFMFGIPTAVVSAALVTFIRRRGNAG